MRQAYYCHTCKEGIDSEDIDQHVQMHKDKNQDCEIQHANGSTYDHKASDKAPDSGIKRPGLGGKS